MSRFQWIAIAIIAALVALEAAVYAQPAPNNCGLNMLCRVRSLIASSTIDTPALTTDSVQTHTGGATELDIGTTGTGTTKLGNTAGSGQISCIGTTCASSAAFQVNGSLLYGSALACSGLGSGGVSGAAIGTQGTNCTLTLTPTGTGSVAVASGFGVSFPGKCDSTAAAGDATCNQGAGRAAIAASSATITITNSLVASTSLVVANLQANDGTCTSVKHVVPGSGSFVITTNAACTGNTNVAWYLASK